ncbi:MAG: DUF374 domain-containing protein [Acidobacteria bacterium]|nr:DUF374 domain-containing protein [Acidobacteriota bacterium]
MKHYTRSSDAPISRRASVIGRSVAAVMGALRASWRVDARGLERFDAALAEGRRGMIVFWHGKYAPLFVLLRDRHACIFASESERGATIATICAWFGHDCVRIPDGGRDESLARMETALRERNATGLAADGPLGPWHKAKRGPIVLASKLGYEIFPVSFAARPCLQSKSRWDRMELPAPFARVRLEVGPPFAVPRDVAESPDAIGSWCERLGHELDDAGAAAASALR